MVGLYTGAEPLKICALYQEPGVGLGRRQRTETMYAVIRTGGKQYKVKAGDTVRVEKLEAEAGKTVKLADVLMVVDGDKVALGSPVVKGATVSAQVKGHGRADKVQIVKFKRRKHYRKQMGHRQSYTELSILDIHTK